MTVLIVQHLIAILFTKPTGTKESIPTFMNPTVVSKLVKSGKAKTGHINSKAVVVMSLV